MQHPTQTTVNALCSKNTYKHINKSDLVGPAPHSAAPDSDPPMCTCHCSDYWVGGPERAELATADRGFVAVHRDDTATSIEKS